MILACQNITKAFGEHVVLKNASFHIEEREKAAIVGINGAGKSTLLKIIMKELAPDEGQTVITRGKTIGYLAQHQEMISGHTIFDEFKRTRTVHEARRRRQAHRIDGPVRKTEP